MTKGKFRHIPVVERERLVGIVSIGDIVKHRLWVMEQKFLGIARLYPERIGARNKTRRDRYVPVADEHRSYRTDIRIQSGSNVHHLQRRGRARER